MFEMEGGKTENGSKVPEAKDEALITGGLGTSSIVEPGQQQLGEA